MSCTNSDFARNQNVRHKAQVEWEGGSDLIQWKSSAVAQTADASQNRVVWGIVSCWLGDEQAITNYIKIPNILL